MARQSRNRNTIWNRLALSLAPGTKRSRRRPNQTVTTAIESLEQRTLLSANPIFVDADATGNDDGSAWTDAYTDLQDALAVAVAGDEIWVAEGDYLPGSNRHSSFVLQTDVQVFGGFDGSETQLDQRDWSQHITILNGDVNGDDIVNTIGGEVDGLITSISNNQENVHHVVAGADGAVLDGFYVQGGNANGICGPGLTPIYVCYAQPFSINYGRGGGMLNLNRSPELNDVVFRWNSALHGGGMYNGNSSSVEMTDVVFDRNLAMYGGAGIRNDNATIDIDNGIFYKNNATAQGAIGGAMLNSGTASVDVMSSSFYGNWAEGGGAIAARGADLSIHNSLLYGNGARSYSGTGELFIVGTGTGFVEYSDVQGGVVSPLVAGAGNIDVFPDWTAPDQGANAPGDIWQTGGDGLQLFEFSPVIDQGDISIPGTPIEDFLGTTRPTGYQVDMGAYEIAGNSIPEIGICLPGTLGGGTQAGTVVLGDHHRREELPPRSGERHEQPREAKVTRGKDSSERRTGRDSKQTATPTGTLQRNSPSFRSQSRSSILDETSSTMQRVGKRLDEIDRIFTDLTRQSNPAHAWLDRV
ncbi:MAG: hypothetical protein CMJ45_08790 [Planctomyces sp.]|nr:hypothetical protein [Planctomyces sp.]